MLQIKKILKNTGILEIKPKENGKFINKIKKF